MGDHPVPIDLEMTFQTPQEAEIVHDVEDLAFVEAMSVVSESVMMVGLLPAYGRSAENIIFSVGGMVDQHSNDLLVVWENLGRSDITPRHELRNIKKSNLPELKEHEILFKNYVDDLIEGFRSTSSFIIDRREFFCVSLMNFLEV